MKHTPGPWKLIDDDMDYIAITDAEQEFGVCRLELDAHIDRETMKADARLIVAAPEMFEALKVLETRPAGYLIEEDWKLIYSLIARVETHASKKSGDDDTGGLSF